MSERDLHEWTAERLSDHVDGGLPASEREAVERHLEACPECREVREGLERVVEAARGLGTIEPPRDLWSGIRRGILTESGGSGGDRDGSESVSSGVVPFDARRRTGGGGVARDGGTRGTGGARGTTSVPVRFPSPPLLAAAAVVLIALSASLAWWGRGAVGYAPPLAGGEGPSSPTSVRAAATGPTGPMSEELAGELERLGSVMAESRERLAPGTVAVLERNLLIIERAIEDSYRALAQDPENDFVRDHLERTYERKLEYLREIASIVERAG